MSRIKQAWKLIFYMIFDSNIIRTNIEYKIGPRCLFRLEGQTQNPIRQQIKLFLSLAQLGPSLFYYWIMDNANNLDFLGIDFELQAEFDEQMK